MATLAEVLRQAGYVTPQGQAVGPRTDLAQKLKSYVMNIPQNAAQNLANQRADIDAALTMGQGGIQIGDREAFARQMAEVPNLMGAIAYHGTPHTIKGKFDISKVGTGEGAQAYGHGMYFAESPDVAKNYATDRSYVGKFMAGTPDKTAWDAQRIAQDTLNVHGDNAVEQLQKTLKANSYSKNPQQIQANKQLEDAIDILKTNQLQPTGNLYKVDIPDEYIPKMIDFEKPLKDQPKDIQDWVIQKDPEAAKAMFTGATLRKFLTSPDTSKQSAEELLAMGYKGIRYLDEGSRNAQQRWIARHPKGGESDFPTLEQAQAFINRYPNDKYTLIEPKPLTSNFVVFDPSEVKILEQNSKPMTRKEIIEQELEKVAK